VNLAASAVNAIIAGCIIAALGEGTIFIFEQVYLGNKKASDIHWMKKILESEYSSKFADTARSLSGKISENMDLRVIAEVVTETIRSLTNNDKPNKSA